MIGISSSKGNYGPFEAIVDSLAAKFASMAKPRIDRAKLIDDNISSKMQLSEDEKQRGISYCSSSIVDSAIFSYLHDAIAKIGAEVDSCLDPCDRWISVDGNGRIIYISELAAGMLSSDYLKYVIECNKEEVTPCQEQQKTPEQSESGQTDDGKQE